MSVLSWVALVLILIVAASAVVHENWWWLLAAAVATVLLDEFLVKVETIDRDPMENQTQ